MPRSKDRQSYGWVIVAAFLFMGTIIYGIHTSYGVFFKSIAGEFSLTRAATSAVWSVQNAFGAMLALVGGWAVDRFGPRAVFLFVGLFTGLSLLLTSQTNALWQLFLTYSLLSSGVGACYTTITSTVSRWFDRNRGLAIGIAGSGPGLGPIAIVPFATYLIYSLDWRWAYIILGLTAWVVIIPLSRLLRRSPAEVKAEPGGINSGSGEMGIAQPENDGGTQLTEFSLRGATRTRSFWLFGAAWLLNAFCFALVSVHIVPHATDIGIPAMEAATILSLIGASSIAGRVLLGKASDSIGGRKTTIICALLAALAMIWLIWVRELSMLYIFSVVFGFFNGGIGTPITALISDTFGMRNIGMIMGSLQAAFGLGLVSGPALAGVIFDINQSYSMAFLLAALAMFAISLLIGLTRREIS